MHALTLGHRSYVLVAGPLTAAAPPVAVQGNLRWRPQEEGEEGLQRPQGPALYVLRNRTRVVSRPFPSVLAMRRLKICQVGVHQLGRSAQMGGSVGPQAGWVGCCGAESRQSCAAPYLPCLVSATWALVGVERRLPGVVSALRRCWIWHCASP